MVRGLEVSKAHFAGHEDKYILIGGTATDAGQPRFYRFEKPADERYPFMLELFSRAPEGLLTDAESHLTPIPIDEAVSSLSAILLDEAYYDFILDGRRTLDGLGLVAEDRLSPLKANAWLDLTRRRRAGAEVDSRRIRKHANDIIQLSQLFTATTSVPLPPSIAADMRAFLSGIEQEGTLDPKALGVKSALPDVLKRIAAAFQLNLESGNT